MRRPVVSALLVVLAITGLFAEAQRRATKAPATKTMDGGPCTVRIVITPNNVAFPPSRPQCFNGFPLTLVVDNQDTQAWTVTLTKTMKPGGGGAPVDVLPNDIVVADAPGGKPTSSSPATINDVKHVPQARYSYTVIVGSDPYDPDLDIAPPTLPGPKEERR